jgi:DNA uptake protein ComE-like DNA-binding protein
MLAGLAFFAANTGLIYAQDATPTVTAKKKHSKKSKKSKAAEMEATPAAETSAPAAEPTPKAKKTRKSKKEKAAATPEASGPAESSSAPAASSSSSAKPPSKSSNLLDINTASEDQLTALGLDSDTASKIIAGRPYKMKSQLKSRKLVTEDQYNQITGKIIAHKVQ